MAQDLMEIAELEARLEDLKTRKTLRKAVTTAELKAFNDEVDAAVAERAAKTKALADVPGGAVVEVIVTPGPDVAGAWRTLRGKLQRIDDDYLVLAGVQELESGEQLGSGFVIPRGNVDTLKAKVDGAWWYAELSVPSEPTATHRT